MLDINTPRLGINPEWFGPNQRYIVKRVCSGSPAQKAGIKPNDILVKMGNTTLLKPEDIGNTKPNFGDSIDIVVQRNGANLTLQAKYPTLSEVSTLMSKITVERSTPTLPVSMEEKLEMLSHMLKKGLITKDDYDLKKKQLLSGM